MDGEEPAGLAAANPHEHAHPQPGELLPDLSPQERTFARALKALHNDLRLATMAVGGTVILFTQNRLPPEQYLLQLREEKAMYLRSIEALRRLTPPPRDYRKRAYLAAATRALAAIEALEATARLDARRVHIRRAGDRLARAHRRMCIIGESFWFPEYVPSSSEGMPHTH
jgi:hypothetical protein